MTLTSFDFGWEKQVTKECREKAEYLESPGIGRTGHFVFEIMVSLGSPG